MKTALKLLAVGVTAFFWSCNGQQSKDTTSRADSTNEAMIDSSQSAGTPPAIAEKDARFAVDAANGGMAEVQLGEMAQNKSTKRFEIDICRSCFHYTEFVYFCTFFWFVY